MTYDYSLDRGVPLSANIDACPVGGFGNSLGEFLQRPADDNILGILN